MSMAVRRRPFVFKIGPRELKSVRGRPPISTGLAVNLLSDSCHADDRGQPVGGMTSMTQCLASVCSAESYWDERAHSIVLRDSAGHHAE
jgi:hypothetical protein